MTEFRGERAAAGRRFAIVVARFNEGVTSALLAGARDAFRAAGAIVDDESGLVRIPREVVESALASAPPAFTVTPRGAARAIEVVRRIARCVLRADHRQLHADAHVRLAAAARLEG